jgi:hypothetical protein
MFQGLSLKFDAVEDRMVLKLHLKQPQADIERSLLLTRRVCAIWWVDLKSMLDLAQSEPQSVYAAASAKHTGKAVKAKLAPDSMPTPEPPVVAELTGEPLAHVLVSAAVLVLRINCARRRSDGRWVMRFHLRDEPLQSLVMTDATLLQLFELLTNRLKAANWALPSPGETGGESKRLPQRSLH